MLTTSRRPFQTKISFVFFFVAHFFFLTCTPAPDYASCRHHVGLALPLAPTAPVTPALSRLLQLSAALGKSSLGPSPPRLPHPPPPDVLFLTASHLFGGTEQHCVDLAVVDRLVSFSNGTGPEQRRKRKEGDNEWLVTMGLAWHSFPYR